MATANLIAAVSTKGAAKTESDLKKVSKQASKTEKNVNKMGGAFKSVSKNAGAAASAITGPLSGISSRISAVTTILTSGTAAATTFGVAIAGAGFIIAQGTSLLDEYDVNLKRVNATLKATGEGVGFTAIQLQDQAKALALATLTSTQEVQKAQTKLLTFNRVLGEEFERAIVLSQDLAEAGFGSITSNAILLGKALQDPVKGISALTRVGVTLDQNQKDLISNAVKQNDVFSAQTVILEALEGQVGGVASAVASGTAAGAVDTLGQRYDELAINVAKSVSSLDAYKRIINGAIRVTEALNDEFEKDPSELFAKSLEKTFELREAQAKLAEIADETSLAYRQQAFEIVGIESALRGIKNEVKEAADIQNKQTKEAGEAAEKEGAARIRINEAVAANNKKVADEKAAKEKTATDKSLAIAQASADKQLSTVLALNASALQVSKNTQQARIDNIESLFDQELISAENRQAALNEIEIAGVAQRDQIQTDQRQKQSDADVADLERKRALFEEQNAIAINAGELLSSSLASGLLDVAKGEQKLGDVIVGTIGKVADSVATALIQQVIQEQIVDRVIAASFLASKVSESSAAVAQAGLNAFAATAAIPVVGPGLALGAAETATGIASGLATGVVSAASTRQQGGNLSAGQTSTLAENNEFEVIAPASASRVRTRQQMQSIMGEGGSGATSVSIVVIDQSTGSKEFTTDEDGEGRTVILIRDIVSGDINNSNSDISKSISNSTNASRRV